LSTNEAEVYFALDGEDFEPDEVISFLGLEPTSVSVKGDPRPKHDSWKLSSGKVVSDYIDTYEMTTSLIEQLESKKELIIEAIKKYNVKPKLEIVLWFTCDENISTPAIGFEEATIKFLGDIGAYIDIDTYKV